MAVADAPISRTAAFQSVRNLMAIDTEETILAQPMDAVVLMWCTSNEC